MDPELSRDLARIFRTSIFQELTLDIRESVLAHAEKFNSLNSLEHWLASLVSEARALLDDATKGGAGSGNFRHAGRPGERGGSAGGGGSLYERFGKESDITGTHTVTRSSLERDGTELVFGSGERIIFGRGTGYFPNPGYNVSSEFFDGRMVVGPEQWVGKDGKDIPEIREEVARQIEDAKSGKGGGDFSQTEYTEDQARIASLMNRYKQQMTSQDAMQEASALAEAYLANGKVQGGELSPGMKAVKQVEDEFPQMKAYAEQRPEIQFLQDYVASYDQRHFKAELDAIFWNKHKARVVDQEAVNQFASEVKRTQQDLRQRYGDAVTLYRGVNGDYAKGLKTVAKKDGAVDVAMKAATSWTSDPAIARKFAGKNGVVIKQSIPTNKVLFSHHTTPYIRTKDFLFGGEEEYEFIVGSGGPLHLTPGDLL